MSTQLQPCTCGEAHPHKIARRITADGKHVLAWSDGSLTWALGNAIKGSPFPRNADQQRRALSAIRLVLDDVCLFDESEVSALIKAARWAADKGTGRPGMFERLETPKRDGRIAGLLPQWTVLQADRDGKPTVRTWKLPRFTHPGLIVWHERGVYHVLRECWRNPFGVPLREPAYESTGFKARTLRGLGEHLVTLRVQEGAS